MYFQSALLAVMQIHLTPFFNFLHTELYCYGANHTTGTALIEARNYLAFHFICSWRMARLLTIIMSCEARFEISDYPTWQVKS
jgi:hypothetical protein